MIYSKENYERLLYAIINDKSICKENKQLYKKFFDYEEYKLKRTNSLTSLDLSTYKTLVAYIFRIRNVNKWFNNKPLKELTKQDIKRVYDGLEEGKILTSFGKPFLDRKSYYSKIFRSKLFEMAGRVNIARDVMEFYKPSNDGQVRFIKEDDARKLVNVMISPKHKLLTWLAFDIGENVNTLLKLRKKDCIRQIDENTKNSEYRINLSKEILKRSRTPRSEITNYPETVEFLDYILKDLQDNDLIFDFQYRMAKKFLDRAVTITGIKCLPKGQRVTWKDLRSSMACDLLNKGWTTDEVNARLGHRPSSKEIDRYVTFLAIDKQTPKRKVYEHNISKMKADLDESKEREKLYDRRIKHLQSEVEEQRKDLDNIKQEIIKTIAADLRKKIQK